MLQRGTNIIKFRNKPMWSDTQADRNIKLIILYQIKVKYKKLVNLEVIYNINMIWYH